MTTNDGSWRYWAETQWMRVQHLGHRIRYWWYWNVLGKPKAGCYCDLRIILRSIQPVGGGPGAAHEHALFMDRLIYGNSFEEEGGRRVDPRRVLLRADGTYELLREPERLPADGRIVQCRFCDGTGKTDLQMLCYVCKGGGYVDVAPKVGQ